MKDPKLEGSTELVVGDQGVIPAECFCMCTMSGSSGIHSSGTNLPQTWAEMHLNMVANIQNTQEALDLSNFSVFFFFF